MSLGRPGLPALPLSKTCNPADLAILPVEIERRRAPRTPPLIREAEWFRDEDLVGQHPMRRWEYALTLHAITAWQAEREPLTAPLALLDVGGAGSPFVPRLQALYGALLTTTLIDPVVNHGIEQSTLPDASVDIVTCLSVLEHVPRPTPFLRACARHLRPGGLMVLTVDYWDCEGEDTAHFHWMRERIYNRRSLTDVMTYCRETLGLRRFGGADWTYFGNHVYDYSFASLVLRKEP